MGVKEDHDHFDETELTNAHANNSLEDQYEGCRASSTNKEEKAASPTTDSGNCYEAGAADRLSNDKAFDRSLASRFRDC